MTIYLQIRRTNKKMNTEYVKMLYKYKNHATLYSEMEIIYLILLMISCVTILIFLFYSILVFDLLRHLAHLITMESCTTENRNSKKTTPLFYVFQTLITFGN